MPLSILIMHTILFVLLPCFVFFYVMGVKELRQCIKQERSCPLGHDEPLTRSWGLLSTHSIPAFFSPASDHVHSSYGCYYLLQPCIGSQGRHNCGEGIRKWQAENEDKKSICGSIS